RMYGRTAIRRFGLDSGSRTSVYWTKFSNFGPISHLDSLQPKAVRMSKKLIFGSMAAAGVVALLSIVDLALKFPFGGYSRTMDILYLLAAAIILYMGWESYRENR